MSYENFLKELEKCGIVLDGNSDKNLFEVSEERFVENGGEKDG